MTKRTKRTDPHRPGAIVPRDYSYVLSFNLSTMCGGWPVPSFGINCELDRRVETRDADGKVISSVNGKHDEDGRCCQIGLLYVAKVKFAPTGAPGKCGICGAHFISGDIWVHDATGEHIHIGHDCADKYQLLADRSDWELMDAKAKRIATMMASRHSGERKFLEFCDKHAGLKEAFEVVLAEGNPNQRQQGALEIIADVKRKLREYGSISEKQIALVMRLAGEIKNPQVQEIERYVDAPLGKAKFVGTIVSTKVVDGYYNDTVKMTVKVTTPDGVWLAWGTAPSGLFHMVGGPLKGRECEISCTLEAGRDSDAKKHFVFMKRPRGKLIPLPQAQEDMAVGQ